MKQIQSIYKTTLRGTTMAEVLVVMIVAGIVFLLVFEGLSIVQQYSRILDRKFSEKSGLLYSHQVLEALLERTDSIRRNENELFFYTSNDPAGIELNLDSTCILLRRTDYTDTLFAGLTAIELHSSTPESSLVDSLLLWVQIGQDTVRLDYGLPLYIGANIKQDTDDTW